MAYVSAGSPLCRKLILYQRKNVIGIRTQKPRQKVIQSRKKGSMGKRCFPFGNAHSNGTTLRFPRLLASIGSEQVLELLFVRFRFVVLSLDRRGRAKDGERLAAITPKLKYRVYEKKPIGKEVAKKLTLEQFLIEEDVAMSEFAIVYGSLTSKRAVEEFPCPGGVLEP